MFANSPSLLESFSIVATISLIVTIISKFTENIYPFHKKECGNGLCPTMDILLIRYIHYFVNFLLVFYILFFSAKYDIYYIIGYSIIILHWLIFDDCILSNWEMSLYNTNTTLGENSLLHPHFRVFVGDYTDYIVLVQILIMTIAFVCIIYRMKNTHFKLLFGALLLIIQFTVVFKSRIKEWYTEAN